MTLLPSKQISVAKPLPFGIYRSVGKPRMKIAEYILSFTCRLFCCEILSHLQKCLCTRNCDRNNQRIKKYGCDTEFIAKWKMYMSIPVHKDACPFIIVWEAPEQLHSDCSSSGSVVVFIFRGIHRTTGSHCDTPTFCIFLTNGRVVLILMLINWRYSCEFLPQFRYQERWGAVDEEIEAGVNFSTRLLHPSI